MKYSPDEHDGCVPESETPETDKEEAELDMARGIMEERGVNELPVLKKKIVRSTFARSLERRLSLADEGRKFREAQVDRIMIEEATVQKSLKERIKKAETALSLAQTEIKGHMRIEDELRAENVKLSAKRSDEMLERGSLHMTQMREQLDEAQARIAELEKLLREVYGEFAERHILATDLQTRIDAALKDRA